MHLLCARHSAWHFKNLSSLNLHNLTRLGSQSSDRLITIPKKYNQEYILSNRHLM